MKFFFNKAGVNLIVCGHSVEINRKNLQHIFSEAPFPFCLVEEVIKVAAKGDENKAKSKESKNP